jgi:hypothetical protein
MDLRRYASLVCGVYTSYSDVNKLVNCVENVSGHKRAFMSAQDIVTCLQEHSTLFEGDARDALTPSPREDNARDDHHRASVPSCAPPTYQESVKQEYSMPPLRSLSLHTAAQDEFMTTCCDVMKNVENGFEERSCLLALDGSQMHNAKKRKMTLAADSIRNVTTILFAANKLLYSASQQP